MVGKMVIVSYDKKRFVGQVLKIVREEIEVSFNATLWDEKLLHMAPNPRCAVLLTIRCNSCHLKTRTINQSNLKIVI
jgi:tRNA(Ile2) C34 agmatinyltransferase TiaS